MQVENKKHAEWRKAVDQRKREATDVEERSAADLTSGHPGHVPGLVASAYM
jgi:hypothetical protein